MDQAVVAGVGNVYRAEILYRHRVDPYLPGRQLDDARWGPLWGDLVALMRAGLRSGRIVTTEPRDRDRPGGKAQREDSHYVYRRAGLPCRICTTPVRMEPLAARKLYWCPTCQAG
jgi:formamidopyrimidine-DNA glycosylase